MVCCSFCHHNFPRLFPPSRGEHTEQTHNVADVTIMCGTCQKRRPGMTPPEIAAINNCPQCAGCGLASQLISEGLCSRCESYYQSADSIPAAILRLGGPVVERLLNRTQIPTSDTGSNNFDVQSKSYELLNRAAAFQSSASSVRLTGHTGRVEINSFRPNNSQPGLSRFKNLQKAQAAKSTRKELKQEEAKNLSTGIRVTATLWTTKSDGKMSQLNPFRDSHVIAPSTPAVEGLKMLLGRLAESFSRKHPDVPQLVWSNAELYAHENQNRYCALSHFNMKLPIAELFSLYVKNRYINETMQKDRKIEVRFVFPHETLYAADLQLNSVRPSLASGMKKRKDPDVGLGRNTPTKSGINSALAGHLRKSAFPTSFPVSSINKPFRSSHLRYSAFPKLGPGNTTNNENNGQAKGPLTKPTSTPSFWSRDCKMLEYSFIRTIAEYKLKDGLTVKFQSFRSTPEDIEIAADWEQKTDAGYIGEGFTKRGIYARFDGREYVLTQPKDTETTAQAVEEMLRAEYGLLCMAHAFKTEFDALVQEVQQATGRTIPDFYFNFPHSIFGQLQERSSGGHHLPHTFFIATPMLPCGPVDKPVVKYTGNDNVGPANDHITRAVHAFAHYCVRMSHEQIVFCDLQGADDDDGIPCLLDLQAHTATKANNSVHAYWDGGKRGIKKFLDQHLAVCKENWVCASLDLSLTSGEMEPSNPSPVKKRTRIARNGEDESRSKRRGHDLDTILNPASGFE